MRLVRLEGGPSQWNDVKDAADILWRSTLNADINAITAALRGHYQNPQLTISELYTGFNASRRAVVVYNTDKITIAFLGSELKEIYMNTWTDGKGWLGIPYPVFENGNRIHSFYRDMWHAMRQATFDALDRAVGDMAARGATPKQIVVAGFSMGGGISIMAFTDILERIRHTWGDQSGSPQSWARDEVLRELVQHITFAAVAAGDQGYYTLLNDLYDRYQIRAWDFMNHCDWTVNFHHGAFRSWRGYRYVLPDAMVRQFGGDFGGNGHGILGYLKVAEWMAGGRDGQVHSEYSY
ncbi:hypothetical protein COCMIDRAFT_29552 [Bipolaris oryzae ATCC 44560]|uniref:Fungal lipase-type domain-containing protein n=1 Tax=Bipolaris oryzae ATCC 44560 TaxID=930090 RepID=W6YW20_COCMI|nr:uncharacterized protein COCMIDRAFT_29552 [Bipolaris oryzae ATCC 44560]EUC41735.1 hypothetical protein COCMIDRAFT_29552 [Bipolaris oryzae ATCC 44560]